MTDTIRSADLEPYERNILQAMSQLMLAVGNADAAIRIAREDHPGVNPNPHTKHPRKHGQMAKAALDILREGMGLTEGLEGAWKG